MWGTPHRKRTDDRKVAVIPSSNRRRGSLRRSDSTTSQPNMLPRLTASISAPSTVGPRRPLPAQDASFRSDISVLSCSSAQERRSWFCGSCSYRNCDMSQNACALCGCGRGISTTPSGRQTIFTIDSSIQLVSRPEAGLSRGSVTTCSRTTGTSVSTKVMSNTTANLTKRLKQRPRAEDDQEADQPPIVSHAPQHHHHHHHHHQDTDDDISIASEDTARMGSLSSDQEDNWSNDSSSDSHPQQGHPSKLNVEASRYASSSSASDSSECSESSPRRAMPHDDPIEQPSYVPRRRRPRQGSDDLDAECPNKPLRATEEPLEMSPLPCVASANGNKKKGRKKKTIKDYIPGLRRRHRDRRRSSATESTSASSSASPPAKDSNHTTPLDREHSDLEEEASFHNHSDPQFMVPCGAQASEEAAAMVSRGAAFRPMATPGLYDA